ncbi:hypothetical protein CIL05_16500 [Virgibacillus profundi]|uniref:BAAT/Acyl-CoA thioester hydrolase C-terminal domain-containing protein n=1 Tax=Virgibacillus profundi TaxID=2024555 RepID=A0A2A2IB70_9BACI|nr:acyl-CoA thioester hydrolase/BAAT C-terminal domain-containing protein [Virgibacillus profundi]PAV28534.1 hypothetical protein CIL05_16500 [Virgibacillus profundi]PXY52707.1 hypothetical protein CIT14_16645 [Virgibacillus profundi]
MTNPEVERLPIRDEGLVGTMFLQKKSNKYPTIIVLGGSEEGLREGDSALLASHGFNTFSLAYFGIEKLPSELVHIPIDYVEKALNWLMNQRDIDPNRIGVMGTSKGGELALLSASMLPSIKAVAGYVPSSVVYPGIGKRGSELSSWTYQGDEIPFATGKVSEAELQQDKREAKTGLQFTYKNIYLQMAKGQEKAEIPVEKINGPILLISGGDDQLWPSEELSDRAIRRLKKYGHRFTYEHITFPLAGHSIGSPNLPTTMSMEAPFGQGVKLLLGGTPKDNAHAQTDAWEKVKRFFKENL